jgi:hypothetical protein
MKIPHLNTMYKQVKERNTAIDIVLKLEAKMHPANSKAPAAQDMPRALPAAAL